MRNQTSSHRYPPSSVAPEFINKVEGELSRRLGQPVTLVLADGIIGVSSEGGLVAGESVVVKVHPLLHRMRTVEWADDLERKIHRLASRAKDVERLYAAIQKSPSPEKTGEIVLDHIGDYDDDFFEALGTMITHEKGCLHLSRVRNFEALRAYLRVVRRRARNGETAAMWRELAQGTAQEKALGNGSLSPLRCA